MATKDESSLRADWRTDKIDRRADQFYLAAVLAQIRSDRRAFVAATDAAVLQSIGRQLTGIAVKDCNYGLSSRDEKRRENLRAKAATIAGWYGLTITASGDPRGYVLRLHGKDLPQNGWGEGFGI